MKQHKQEIRVFEESYKRKEEEFKALGYKVENGRLVPNIDIKLLYESSPAMTPARIQRRESLLNEIAKTQQMAKYRMRGTILLYMSMDDTRLFDEARAMLIKHLTAKPTEDDIFKYEQDQTVGKAEDEDASQQ